MTILPEDVPSACATWHCSDPVPNGLHGRAALVWTTSERKERPKVQLCAAEDSGLLVASIDSTRSPNYTYVTFVQHSAVQRELIAYLDK